MSDVQAKDPEQDPRLSSQQVSDPIGRSSLPKYIVLTAMRCADHPGPNLLRLGHTLGLGLQNSPDPSAIALLGPALTEDLGPIPHEVTFHHLLQYASALCANMGDLLEAATWIQKSTALVVSLETAAGSLASHAPGGQRSTLIDRSERPTSSDLARRMTPAMGLVGTLTAYRV